MAPTVEHETEAHQACGDESDHAQYPKDADRVTRCGMNEDCTRDHDRTDQERMGDIVRCGLDSFNQFFHAAKFEVELQFIAPDLAHDRTDVGWKFLGGTQV